MFCIWIQHVLCLVCRADDLPVYTNGEISHSSMDTAPYHVDEVVSYACSSSYKPSPSNASLTCTCAMVDDIAFWVCDPRNTSDTCQECKSFDHTLSGRVLEDVLGLEDTF